MSEKGLEPDIEAALVQCRRSATSGHCPFVDSFCLIGDRRAISSHSSGGVIIRSKDYWGIEKIVAIRPVAAEVQRRFISLLDEHLPNWRTHRHELNAAPLAHNTWRY